MISTVEQSVRKWQWVVRYCDSVDNDTAPSFEPNYTVTLEINAVSQTWIFIDFHITIKSQTKSSLYDNGLYIDVFLVLR